MKLDGQASPTIFCCKQCIYGAAEVIPDLVGYDCTLQTYYCANNYLRWEDEEYGCHPRIMPSMLQDGGPDRSKVEQVEQVGHAYQCGMLDLLDQGGLTPGLKQHEFTLLCQATFWNLPWPTSCTPEGQCVCVLVLRFQGVVFC